MAFFTRPAVFLAPSLAQRFIRWVSTVLIDKKSVLAISWLVLSDKINSKTSFSRRVSLGMNAHRGPRASLKGKGSWSPSVITDLIDAAPAGTIDSALLAYGWNLLCFDALEVMVGCQRAGVKVHVAGTFGGDLYSIFRPVGAAQEAKVAAWQSLADEHGVSLAAVAIHFAFLPACVTLCLFACQSPTLSLSLTSDL